MVKQNFDPSPQDSVEYMFVDCSLLWIKSHLYFACILSLFVIIQPLGLNLKCLNQQIPQNVVSNYNLFIIVKASEQALNYFRSGIFPHGH